jgi:molybdopterin biosynthesis enzyme
MFQVKVDDAVGMVLAHDITKVVPGVFKGVAFKKGHIIQKQDIEELKNLGKYHIYILSLTENELHESEGAKRLAQAISGKNVTLSHEKEGKVEIFSSVHGRFDLDISALNELNDNEGIIVATRHQNIVVKPNDILAGAKIIPLVIEKSMIEKIEAQFKGDRKLLNVVPFLPLKVGILVTGSEVYYKRIEDKFAAVLEDKIKKMNGTLIEKRFAPDDLDYITQEIKALIECGSECILISGGMSVDPDDLTPKAISLVADTIITYGSPVLPGAMFMLAYKGELPIIGVPACGMFNKATILDLVLPFIFTQEKITRTMINHKAHGGLCLKCDVCIFPHCEFGKG